MKKIALAATLIFSTVVAFNNTGNYLAKIFANNTEQQQTPLIRSSDEYIPLRVGRADLAQADGYQN